MSVGETPCAPILTPSLTSASALRWGEEQHSPKGPCAPSAPRPSSPHEADSSERSPQSSSRSHVQEMGMQRPLAQENWLGEQVRAGPGRDRQSFSKPAGPRFAGGKAGNKPPGAPVRHRCRSQTGCKVGSRDARGPETSASALQHAGNSEGCGSAQQCELSLCSPRMRQAPHPSRWSWTRPHCSRSRCPHRRASGWGCSGCSCT